MFICSSIVTELPLTAHSGRGVLILYTMVVYGLLSLMEVHMQTTTIIVRYTATELPVYVLDVVEELSQWLQQ